jgi:predicted transposase YdaD
LRFENDVISQLFTEEIMQESVFYQSIIEKREQRGRKQGEVAMLLRLLTRRVGAIAPDIENQIQQLSIPQLEDLGEALLDFSSVNDLTSWLENHQS